MLFFVFIGCEQSDLWENINSGRIIDDSVMKIECTNITQPVDPGYPIVLKYTFNQVLDNNDFMIKISEHQQQIDGATSNTPFYGVEGSLETDYRTVTFYVMPQPETYMIVIKLFSFHSGDNYLNDIITGHQDVRTLSNSNGRWE